VEQLHENLKAVEVAPKLTPNVLERIDEAFGVKKRRGRGLNSSSRAGKDRGKSKE